jgi:glutathionyl-hydroquinone reductase
MGPIKPLAHYIGNQYIIIAIDYTTKWVEVKALRDKTTISIVENLYENIIKQFNCPTHLVGDQGNHFINNSIELLV